MHAAFPHQHFSSSSSSTAQSHDDDHQPPSTKLSQCVVCLRNRSSSSMHSGVLACHSCTLFFRQSALDGKKWRHICRKGRTRCAAAIQADRKQAMCPACRYRRCLAIGMQLDSASETAFEPQFDRLALHSAESFVADEKNDLHHNLNIPTIVEMVKFVKDFRSVHQALAATMLGSLVSLFRTNKQQAHLITLNEHQQLEQGKIRHAFMLIRKQFPQIASQNSELAKVQFLKNFCMQLSLMLIADNTLKAFPNESHHFHQLMLHPGCLIDSNNLAHFFSTLGTDENVDEQIRMCHLLLDRTRQFIVQRYRPLCINEFEFAAIVGIVLWISVDHFAQMPLEMLTYRDQLFAELYALMRVQQSALADVAIRMGNLMNLVAELSKIACETEQQCAVVKLFLPPPTNTCCNEEEGEGVTEMEEEAMTNDFKYS